MSLLSQAKSLGSLSPRQAIRGHSECPFLIRPAERLGNPDNMSKSTRLQLGALVRHLGRTKTQRTKTGTGPDIDLGPTHEWHLVMRNCLAAFGVSSHFLVSSIGRRV